MSTTPDRPADERQLARDVARVARRLVRHLLRRTALVAAIVSAFAVIAVAQAGVGSAVGQGALVVIGVLVSVAVLPDAPVPFWRVKARDLAETVPQDALVQASYEVFAAIGTQRMSPLDPEHRQLLWDATLSEVLHVLADPTRVSVNTRYDITVKPLAEEPFVRTSISAERCYPGVDTLFWSVCSNLAALHREFEAQATGCLSREVIRARPGEGMEEWAERVRGMHVVLHIDGARVEPQGVSVYYPDQAGGCGVVRFEFPAGPVAQAITPYNLVTEFPIAHDLADFPLVFGSYFCVGQTEVTFRIEVPGLRVVEHDYMSSVHTQVELSHEEHDWGTEIWLRTSKKAVLHPGSGVLFQWQSA